MLELKGVKAYYGKIEALKGIDLQINQGEIVTLIGGNGAGKSTCLMTICGLVEAGAGEILFEGEPIHQLKPAQIVARGISQVPEGRRIFADFSVAENLEMGAYLRRDPAQVKEDLNYLYDQFNILAERRSQRAGTLSGGEQQMLAIARALMARPRLLLLDEPSLGLAPLIIRQIFDMITQINQTQGTTIFLVEQNAHLALQTAHRAYVLENGSIGLGGDAKDLRGNESIKKAYLGIAD
ncbi:MAG: ABC transporter ATP-binding protein [bacterium]|nr:ABC transporter ATP-binding protein [bacterium]